MAKILLIEDEEALQKSLTRALELEGFKMINAYDGKTGVQMATKENPNLILLDLILPKIDGFEIFKILKGDPKTRDIPIIILTNLEQVQGIDKLIEYGPINYLVKANYTLDEIVVKIKETLTK